MVRGRQKEIQLDIERIIARDDEEANKVLRERVEERQQTCLSYALENIELATQARELLERHTNSLCSQLKQV